MRLLWIRGDAARIEQAIANLLNNATKYTQTGGQIRVHAEEEGTQVVIRIRDSGIGIDPEALPHIFELFVQGTRHVDHPQSGLGLGLALVKKVVELHGGTMEAFSAGVSQGRNLWFVSRAFAKQRWNRVFILNLKILTRQGLRPISVNLF